MTDTSASCEATELLCVRCGYDLRGQVEHRCPECGLKFDPDQPSPPAIPWLRRQELGWFRAYYGTAFLVVVRPLEFAQQAWRWTALEHCEGERFRSATVIVATVSVVVTGIICEMALARVYAVELFAHSVLAAASAFAFFSIGTLRLAVRLTDIAGRDVDQRFAELQNFCCAGLGFAPLMPIVAAGSALLGQAGVITTEGPTRAVIAGVFVVAAAWSAGLTLFLGFAGKVGVARFVFYVIGVLALWFWAALAALTIGAIIATAEYKLGVSRI